MARAGAVLLVWLCLASSLTAQTWTGGGSDDNWSTGGNWSGGSAPANNGTASILVAGSTRTTPYVDVNYDVLGITFSNNASAFTLYGNQLTVRTSGIVNNSTSSQTFSNNMVMNGAQTWNAASGNLTFYGTVANGGSLLTVNGSSNTTLDGAVSGTGGLTKSGTGTLTLSGANTFSGTLTLSAGTLAVGHDSGTGTGGLTISSGTIQSSGAAHYVSNTVTASGNFTIGGSQDLTFTGDINLSADRTITVNNSGTTTFAGKLGQTSGSPKFTKAGTGTLVLTASNGITDTMTVSAGALRAQHNYALGTTAAGTTVSSGAALELAGGVSIGAEALTLNGTGVSSGGALRNVSGDNSLAGAVTLGANTTINSDSGTLTLSGGLATAGFTATVGGASDTVLSGIVSGSGDLTKEGAGSLTLSGGADNTFTGPLTVNAGTLLLNKTAGFDASAGTMTIGDGSGGASADVVRLLANNQIRDDKAVTIKTSGLLDLNGYSDEIQVSTIEGGAITTGSGTWTMGGHLTANATNQTATISGNVNLGANRDFTVNDGSVDADLYVTATLSGAYNLEKKGAGTLVLGGANTFSGGAVLTLGTLAVSNDLALGSGTFTLDAGTVRAEGGSRTITNAMSWAGNFSIGGSQDITFAGDATVAADRTITVDNTGVTTISGSFGDSKKIYKQGSGTLVLSGANSQAETYVQAGVINVRNSSALGGTKKTVVSDGAALELQGGLAMGNEALEIYGSGVSGGGALRSVSGANSWAGNITLKSAGTIAADADTLTISGNINQGAYAGTYAGSGNLTVSGIISGTGSLTKSGTGTLTLSGVNTFSGGATISAGTVAINSSSSLGTAAATINAGTLKATETFTETRNFTLGSSSSTMEVDASKTFTVNGVMSGTGGLVKTGNGTLIVGGANTFTGTLSVNAGTFKLGAADRISNSANVSLGGGTFHSGGYNETVGTLTLANDSIIDLGSSASVINFASSAAAAWTAGKTLTITNWNGNWMTGGGTDRIFFGSDSSGLTASQLSQIRFADPDGYYTTVAILANGEIVPVPEPATVLAVFLVGGLVAYRERRSLARLASRLRRPAG